MQTRATEALPFPAWLFDFLLPTHCASCGAPGALLCAACTRSLAPVGPPLCARCGAPTAWPVERCRECSGRRLSFDAARAAVCYEGPVPRLVSSWKERGLRRFAVSAAELVAQRVPRPDADVITSIPPDGRRALERGHHPARELAAMLAQRWELPADELLARTRPTVRQTGLPRADRRRNVRGAFAPARDFVPPRILLVDDVYTTGATVDAAAAALRVAGAATIHVVTFARATRGVR